MNKEHYAVKEGQYFSNVRMDIISLLPVNPNQKILEIGAGGANTLLHIKENKLASEVMGVELIEISNSNQSHPSIDKIQIANIEHQEIQAAPEYFDVIICADVLEHLADPWSAINKITTHLKKGGLLIASVPNIREWKTMARILFKGDFRYDPAGGIMDKTHLRFFCRKNIMEMLDTQDLQPIKILPNFILPVVKDGKKRRIINRLSFGLFRDFLAVQYLAVAKKK